MMDANTEVMALKFDPFSSDEGYPGDVALSDKFRTCRKPGRCHYCLNIIVKSERYRAIVEVAFGKIRTFKFCAECCKAMAKSWSDDGRAISDRIVRQ